MKIPSSREISLLTVSNLSPSINHTKSWTSLAFLIMWFFRHLSVLLESNALSSSLTLTEVRVFYLWTLCVLLWTFSLVCTLKWVSTNYIFVKCFIRNLFTHDLPAFLSLFRITGLRICRICTETFCSKSCDWVLWDFVVESVTFKVPHDISLLQAMTRVMAVKHRYTGKLVAPSLWRHTVLILHVQVYFLFELRHFGDGRAKKKHILPIRWY